MGAYPARVLVTVCPSRVLVTVLPCPRGGGAHPPQRWWGSPAPAVVGLTCLRGGGAHPPWPRGEAEGVRVGGGRFPPKPGNRVNLR